MFAVEQLAGRPQRTFRGRPIASLVIDPYVIGTAAVAILAAAAAAGFPLAATVTGAAAVAGWSSAWSP